MGFLTSICSKKLNTNQADAQSQKNPTYIVTMRPCLLRYGVEKSINQSFTARLAEIYSYKQNTQKIPSIMEMRQILIKSISLDLFVKYQNGLLVESFSKKVISRK